MIGSRSSDFVQLLGYDLSPALTDDLPYGRLPAIRNML